jgi:hypothetical protein
MMRGWIDTLWQPLIIGQSDKLVISRMSADGWSWMASELGELR